MSQKSKLKKNLSKLAASIATGRFLDVDAFKARCAAKRNARMARAHRIWSKLGPKEPIPFYNRATERAFNKPDVRVK